MINSRASLKPIIAVVLFLLAFFLLFDLTPANATPPANDTKVVTWLMPEGAGPGNIKWPQTLLESPPEGERYCQQDTYLYKQQKHRDIVDALIAGKVLNSPKDDNQVYRSHVIIQCGIIVTPTPTPEVTPSPTPSTPEPTATSTPSATPTIEPSEPAVTPTPTSTASPSASPTSTIVLVPLPTSEVGSPASAPPTDQAPLRELAATGSQGTLLAILASSLVAVGGLLIAVKRYRNRRYNTTDAS